MIWWFLILALSGGAVLWAAIAAYLRVRRHMDKTDTSVKARSGEEADTQ